MAKSKNHTNHNQIRKAHRNGIKKPKFLGKISTRGVDQKMLRNRKYVVAGNLKCREALRAQHKAENKAKAQTA